MAEGYSIINKGSDMGPFLPGRIDLAQAFAIKGASGLAPRQVLEGMAQLDPAAMQVLVWFLTTYRYDPASGRYVGTGQNVPLGSINMQYDDLEMRAYNDEVPAPAVVPGESVSPISENVAPDTSSSSPTSAI